MYYTDDKNQLSLDEFFLPFGGHLRKDNRWVKLAEIMPWDYIEKIYLSTMSQRTGRKAISSRIAFGSIYIRQSEKLSDEGTVAAIQENPYMQYFLGLSEFNDEPLFDPSMMVHFRKRFPVEEIARINEYVCTGKWPEEIRNVDRNDNDDNDDNDETPTSGSSKTMDISDDKEHNKESSKGKKNRNTSKKKKHRKNKGKLVMDATIAPLI